MLDWCPVRLFSLYLPVKTMKFLFSASSSFFGLRYRFVLFALYRATFDAYMNTPQVWKGGCHVFFIRLPTCSVTFDVDSDSFHVLNRPFPVHILRLPT